MQSSAAADRSGLSIRAAREQLPVLLGSDFPVVVGAGSGTQGVVMSKRAYDDLCERAAFAATTVGSLTAQGLEVSAEAVRDLQDYVRGTLGLDQLRRRALDRYEAAGSSTQEGPGRRADRGLREATRTTA